MAPHRKRRYILGKKGTIDVFLKNSSLLRGMVQTKLVYGNDDQGRVYENCKFYDPQGRGSFARQGVTI